MLKRVWEVYERDTQRCVIFNDEFSARNQVIFDEVDIISESNVELSESERKTLFNGGYIWV